MRIVLFACAALGVVFFASPSFAGPLHDGIGAPQSLKVRAIVRSRTEAIDGQFRPAKAEDDFLQSFRSQLLIEYDTGPLRIGAELIDVRGYGQKDASSVGTGEVNALELSQAYLGFDLGDALSKGSKSSVNVGRYVLAINSKRLMDGAGSRNTVNAHTGAFIDWKRKDDKFVAFWSMPHIRLPEDAASIRNNEVEWDLETSDIQLWGASFTKGALFGEGTMELYAYGLAERDSADRPTSNRRLFTPGGRAFREPAEGKLDFDLEAAYQFGHVRASKAAADRADLDVSAWFTHAEVGRTFATAWAPRLSVHFDLATGDGRKPDTYNRFDALYGSRRSDFGPVGLYGPISRSNLVSGGLRFDVEPSDRLDVFVMARTLWLHDATDGFGSTGVRDRTGGSANHAGTQAEARVRYWIVPKMIRLDTGIAHLRKGRFLTDAPNAPATGNTNYGYLDMIFEI